MFYIVNYEDRILENITHAPTQDELQAEANLFGCSVYVIRGEHYGMSADPDQDETEEDETP